MLYSEFLKTLLSLKLKVPTKNWPPNGTQTNTKSIESQLKSSFMRLLKPLRFSLIETKEPIMMNLWVMNTIFRMQTKHSRNSSMSMVQKVKKRRSSLINTIQIHWIITIMSLESLKMLLLMKPKQHTENWLLNIIPKIILIIKKLIRNSLR